MTKSVRVVADDEAMEQALALARAASESGETPVGSVIVRGGEIIGRGQERTKGSRDLTAHAEVEALRAAALATGSPRLAGCTLVTTVEPCVLCGYAIRRAGIARVVYGVAAGQVGAVTSRYSILTDTGLPGWPDAPEIVAGVMQQECAEALRAR